MHALLVNFFINTNILALLMNKSDENQVLIAIIQQPIYIATWFLCFGARFFGGLHLKT